MKKQIFTELIWLVATGVITYLILIIFGFSFYPDQIDVAVHDSYFVMEKSSLFIVCLLLMLFLVYGIRTLYLRFRITMVNILFLVFNGMMVLMTTNLLMLALPLGFLAGLDGLQVNSSGWTVYPPLSEFNKPEATFHNENMVFPLFCIQAIFVGILILASFKTGKNYLKK